MTMSGFFKKSEPIFTALDNQARFVGGCVRDSILGLPIKDIDIATPYKPLEVIKRLEKSGIKAIPTGIEHGTITAIINGDNFEITTLRKDTECDGRHAEVEFTDSWEEDAARRDFTINAMSMDYEGNIYDYFSGRKDLEKGLVRFVGNAKERCQEDYLRILRYFRFFARYSKSEFDSEAISACEALAKNLEKISGERIQSEMLRLFSSNKPAATIQAMIVHNILPYILPDISKAQFLYKLESSDHYPDEQPLLVLFAMLHENALDQNYINKLSDRWKLSNKDKAYLKTTHSAMQDLLGLEPTENQLIPSCLQRMQPGIKFMAVKYGRDIAKDSLLLLSINSADNNYTGLLEYLINLEIPVFPLSGQDIKNLGIPEGRELGDKLRKAEKIWYESEFTLGRDELLKLI